MTLFYAEGDIALHCGDCLEALEGLCGSFDLVIADPPYTTGIASFGEDTKASGWGDIMNSAHFNAAWLRHCRRLTDAKQGSAWVFNSWRSFPILTRASYEIKWPIVSTLVWDKEWIGPGGPQGLRPSYELAALFCHKGFALQNRSLPDIWRHKWHSKKPNGHPAEKPLALYRRIIQETGAKSILDPFCGSGTTLEAAKLEGVAAVGIEIEPSWCQVAVERLQQQVLPL